MPSRADARRWLERGLRLTSIAVLAAMLWQSLRAPRAPSGARAAGSATLAGALGRWSADADADSLALRLDTVPGPAARDWLLALRRAGARVAWRGDSIPALALALEPRNEPGGGARALVAAPAGARVAVGDAAGVVDTIAVERGGGALRLAALVPPARAAVGPHRARAAAPGELAPGRVLVLGTAGWEAKFAVAALEERGWMVDARLRVAPAVEVEQGRLSALDTARHAAVVALDSTAAPWAARIARFVRDGGGLVLAGTAARAPALARLAPAALGDRIAAPATGLAADAPRRSLGFWPLVRPVRDAVPLEARDGRLAAAARRVGAGRVVQLGDDESWRWRMEGGADGPEAHRAWWSAVVGAAAYRRAASGIDSTRAREAAPASRDVTTGGAEPHRGVSSGSESTPASPPAERDAAVTGSAPHRSDAARTDSSRAAPPVERDAAATDSAPHLSGAGDIEALLARADAALADPAPLASLVDALGPAARELPAGAAPDEEPAAPGPRGWMLVALLAALLAEWTSRRLRGAP